MITRRDFLKVSGVAAAAAALTACGGSSSTASSAASGTASSAAASTAAKLDKVKVAVPNDTTNEARALLLLQDNGYITLKDGVGLTATIKDIVENPHNITFVELEAAQVPRTLPEVSFGVLNGNYAMEAGLTVADDALLYESDDSEAAATYVNVIAVKEGNENLPKIKALVDTLKSDEIKQFINDNYNGGVIPYK